MTLRASKPAFNVREKLTELGRRFGLKGSELAAAETVQEAREIVSAGRKNLIINGNPIVYQRAQTATSIANYQYHTADRWRFSASGTGSSTNRVTNMSVVTNTDIAGDFIGNYVRYDTTTASTNPASNASAGYNYRMEPQDIVPYLGKDMTISFYARSNAGIAINSGFVSGTTASSIYLMDPNDSSTWVRLTSDWKRYKFTFTLGTTVPSTFLDIAFRHQPGIVGNVDMTGIQLEAGRNATDFEHRSYGEELALCQRYFQGWNATSSTERAKTGIKVYDFEGNSSVNQTTTIGTGSVVDADDARIEFSFPVTMREKPTPTAGDLRLAVGSTLYNSSTTIQYNNSTTHNFSALVDNGGGMTAGQAAILIIKGNGYFYLDAEL